MIHELLVVGAGPAGVSAALWARSLGIEVLVLEAGDRVGGQLQNVHFHPMNVAGVAEGDGPALAKSLARQLSAAAVALRLDTPAGSLAPSPPASDSVAVTTATGERLDARAILVATGVRRRRLQAPGDRELEGRGVSYSGRKDLATLAGRRVVVVGGGDAAFENALLLADAGCRVTLVARGRPRAREEFRGRVARSPSIEVWERSRVLAIEGDDRVRRVRVERGGSPVEIETEGVVVKIGVVPNTEWCRDVLRVQEDGYIVASADHSTSAPRVWAAGDVIRPPLFGVTVAAGQGALAVASIRAVLGR